METWEITAICGFITHKKVIEGSYGLAKKVSNIFPQSFIISYNRIK